MPRETFIEAATGKSFELDTELLASDSNFRFRLNEGRFWSGKRAAAHFAVLRASTRSSRKGKTEGRPTYATGFTHKELHLCAHGQNQTFCIHCGAWHCTCPGSPAHGCKVVA